MGNENSGNAYASDSSDSGGDGGASDRMFLELEGGVVSANAGEEMRGTVHV